MESEFAVESCVRYHVYKNLWDASVGEELPYKKDNGNEKGPYPVAVMRRSTIVGHVPRKVSVACSQFLAGQRQRYYSIMSACARALLQDPSHMRA